MPIQTEKNRKQLILCIDNEQQIINGMSSLLDDWGFKVIAANNECQAEKMLDNSLPNLPPSLIIIDYHLDANVTGIDVVKSLQRKWSVKIPCLVITADYTEEVKSKIESQGCLLLRKPVKPMALRSLINKLIV